MHVFFKTTHTNAAPKLLLMNFGIQHFRINDLTMVIRELTFLNEALNAIILVIEEVSLYTYNWEPLC